MRALKALHIPSCVLHPDYSGTWIPLTQIARGH